VQLLTAALYPLIALALLRAPRREPLPAEAVSVNPREPRRILAVLAAVLGLGLILSFWAGTPVTFVPVVANFLVWTPLGFVLTGLAWARQIRRQCPGSPAAASCSIGLLAAGLGLCSLDAAGATVDSGRLERQAASAVKHLER
jgi:hypothetical protein